MLVEAGPIAELSPLASKYVELSPSQLGAQNVVTAVIVTFRGLDTLGEVTVLFIATAGVGFLLRRRKDALPEGKKREGSEILKTVSGFLYPLFFIFGAYIFVHGHLTPGGGFQGGVIIASGVLMVMLANVEYKPDHTVLHIVEGFSGVIFVLLGIAGLAVAGGFLDNRFLPIGETGRLFSAGAMGIIYSAIGLKVGSELSGILQSFGGDR